MTQIDECKGKMQNSISVFENALSQIRTSGANPSLISNVEIEYYGMMTPINQIAGISVIEGKQLLVKPYENHIVKDIEKAIFAANLGLTPQNEGTQIRINVPPLTEDRRKEYAKKVSVMAEECKVSIRNIRRDYNDLIKKDKTIPEDLQKDMLEQIQKATDEAIKNLEKVAENKQKEIMKV
ncbi:MAG: ribosome recycling factor [Erysipelotrichaceae bacterium]|nr:ribosome recycling factor [Erysipelotrichaceae bacterium]